MNKWIDQLKGESIFFVTPDVKRGLGLDCLLPNYHIICSFYDPLIPILRKQGQSVFCLEEHLKDTVRSINNSGSLLNHPFVERFIKDNTKHVPYIAYFKPSRKIDFLIKNKKYKAVGNKTDLNELFEDKIKFQQMLKILLPSYALPSIIGKFSDFKFNNLVKQFGTPIVIQFGKGWAGKTTFFITDEKQFNHLKTQYVFTTVKVSKKITGVSLLNNCCIYGRHILISPPAYQISSLPLFYDKPAVTCGRQWPASILDSKYIREIEKVSQKIGQFMINKGYQGYFGIDFLMEKTNGKIWVSELNARLTASSGFYTHLEKAQNCVPVLSYHFAQFLKKKIDLQRHAVSIIGSQVMIRREIGFKPADDGVYQTGQKEKTLKRKEYKVEDLKMNEFVYLKKLNSDKPIDDKELARIETRCEVLDTHGKPVPWIQKLFQSESLGNTKRVIDHKQ